MVPLALAKGMPRRHSSHVCPAPLVRLGVSRIIFTNQMRIQTELKVRAPLSLSHRILWGRVQAPKYPLFLYSLLRGAVEMEDSSVHSLCQP